MKDNLFDEVSTQENSQGIIFLYSKNLNTIEDIKGDVVILDDMIDCFYTTIIRDRELLARYSNGSLFDCLVKLQYRLKEI